jgi:putative transposase
MARIARVVAPGFPHHITQRGNRRQKTFFRNEDYRLYRSLMAEWSRRQDVEIWAYCLMPNHVHLIAVPKSKNGLCRAIGEAHRRYTRHINFRENWRGYLWQGRFASFVMDENHLMAATRYVELNPVRAGLIHRPEAYSWSSAAAHLKGDNDELVTVSPLLEMVSDWEVFLSGGLSEFEIEKMRNHTRTGRPLGSESFVAGLEQRLGRMLLRRKPGPKGKGMPN